MRKPRLITIEERRYAALVEALKLALFALNIAPRFCCGSTDSYRIATQIVAVLRDSPSAEPPPEPPTHQVCAALEKARRAIVEATDIMYFENGFPAALDGANIERIYGTLCSVLVEIEEAQR